MESLQESSPISSGLEASPVPGHKIDLTEDLSQQLEDIISTYQADEIPVEPEDAEEVTSVKEADTRKEQKLEKKMLKNLGLLCFQCVFSGLLTEALLPFDGGCLTFREGGHAADAESEQTQHSGAETRGHHQKTRWAGELKE